MQLRAFERYITLKLNVFFTLSIQFLFKNLIFVKLPPFQLNNV